MASRQAQETPANKIKAVATFSILGDLVRNVGGDRAEVENACRAEWDVHVYSPTPGDARKLAAANIVFVNGLGLEGWMTRLAAASNTKSPMVVVSKGITPRRMEEEENPAAASRSIRMRGNLLPTPRSMLRTFATA